MPNSNLPIQNTKIALAHDSLTQLGGAERVVEIFHRMLPEAPIFTLVLDKKLKEHYRGWSIKTSWLQKIYNIFPKLQLLLPLIPSATSSLNFSGFNVVLSSSSGFIKNIILPKNVLQINYCHTPARFLWSEPGYVDQEVPIFLKFLVNRLLIWMRKWDYAGAQSVNKFIANSVEVQRRIRQYYNRDSEVIYPSIDTNFWSPTVPKSNYFLIAGRLQAHKNNELVIKVFNELSLPLHVVGTGRQYTYLRSIAKSNITFLGKVDDRQLRDEYSGALGYIYPQVEDFGLMPLEAGACGTATLAYGKGGSLETVIAGQTGELFGVYNKEIIKQAVLNWRPEKYSVQSLREHTGKFSHKTFIEKLTKFITTAYENSY